MESTETNVRPYFLNAWPYKTGRKMNLPVKNVEEAEDFYRTVFDFEVVDRKDTPFKKIQFKKDDIEIAIEENGGEPEEEGCFFEVDNLEAALSELKKKGGVKQDTVATAQKHGDKSWKVFFVVAPDGLCYCIGQSVK